MSDKTYASSNKAFLFAISKTGEFSPRKMKLLTGSQDYSIYKDPNSGPTFGKFGYRGLKVNGQSVFVNYGNCHHNGSYEAFPSPINGHVFNIKEMEVFQITKNSENPNIYSCEDGW
jgi:hypothetical protein